MMQTRSIKLWSPLNAVRLYEGVDPDDVDFQLIDFFPELEIEGSDDAPYTRVDSEQLDPLGVEVEQRAFDLCRGDPVMNMAAAMRRFTSSRSSSRQQIRTRLRWWTGSQVSGRPVAAARY